MAEIVVLDAVIMMIIPERGWLLYELARREDYNQSSFTQGRRRIWMSQQ